MPENNYKRQESGAEAENASVRPEERKTAGSEERGAGGTDNQAENSASGATVFSARYRLYDKIKDQVSLRTVDAIILITAALIIGLLVYGILSRGA